MAFHGDLASFPLPELLQWLDSSRKTGSLTLLWEGTERRLFLLAGQVAGMSAHGLRERVVRLLELGGIAPAGRTLSALRAAATGEEVGPAFASHGLQPGPVMELAREALLGAVVDLTEAGNGTFHWTEDVDRSGDEWIPAAVGLRELLFESLRWLDEAPDVARTLAGEHLDVRARTVPGPHLSALQRVLLSACAGGVRLGRLQLTMATSRAATLRHVYDLLRLKLVEVEGAATPEVDPVMDMLEKGAVLIRERQFDAAALVASTLRSSDPVDRRVREFSRMVELEHVGALYGELPPLQALVALQVPSEALAHLRSEERQLLGLVNGTWDVSTLVLASPLPELETLKVLARLVRQGIIAL
jgi:hypothetical protein